MRVMHAATTVDGRFLLYEFCLTITRLRRTYDLASLSAGIREALRAGWLLLSLLLRVRAGVGNTARVSFSRRRRQMAETAFAGNERGPAAAPARTYTFDSSLLFFFFFFCTCLHCVTSGAFLGVTEGFLAFPARRSGPDRGLGLSVFPSSGRLAGLRRDGKGGRVVLSPLRKSWDV